VNGSTTVPEERQLARLPHGGESLSLRLDCCGEDLPTRALELQGSRVFVSAPLHLCRRSEIGAGFIATWDAKAGVCRSSGTVESLRRHPPAWVLRFEGSVDVLDIEKRFSDDSAGLLDIGDARLPARIIDRSLHGVGCLVPALTKLRPGQRVRVIVGRHDRAGTVARVRSFGNQLRVGIRLDDV
jgi:hypothetical protein